MKAAVFHGQRDVRLDDVSEPEVREESVKVKVDWCGICGTDLHEYLAEPIFIPAARTRLPATSCRSRWATSSPARSSRSVTTSR